MVLEIIETQRDLAVIPPNSTLIYEVEMISFTKEQELWDMDTTEKIEASKQKKEQGNSLFKVGKYQRAAKKYEKVAKYIQHDSSFSAKEKKQSKVLKVLCNLNHAACCLKLKDFKKEVKLRSKVLEFESQNMKRLKTAKFRHLNYVFVITQQFHSPLRNCCSYIF